MFKFNPGLYIDDNDDMYSLVRCETNIGGGFRKPKKNSNNWGRSIFSYELNKVNIDTLESTYIDNIQFNMYGDTACGTHQQRNKLREGEYILEDVKFAPGLGQKNKFICNVLIKHGLHDRVFRVGIGTFDITKPELRLDKILELPEPTDENSRPGTMMSEEKNWCPYIYNDEVYLIYRLFPVLTIYKLSLNDYSMKLVHVSDTYDIIEGSYIDREQNPSYKQLYLTPCTSPVRIDSDNMLFFCKRACSNRIYEYYKCYFNARTFDISLPELSVPFTKGYKQYLNNIILHNNEVYMGWGIRDTDSVIDKYPKSSVVDSSFNLKDKK